MHKIIDMPSFSIAQLIDDLQRDVRHTLKITEELQTLPDNVLLMQPAADKWSIAQVLEHLNGYNHFYLAVLADGFRQNKPKTVATFKAGWFGNYFTNMMLPKSDGTIGMRMTAPKEYNFPPNLDIRKVINEFIEGQNRLLALLDHARKYDIGKIRVAISLTRYIKLKSGDTFRFLVAHQLRHFLQVERTKVAVLQQHNT